MTTLDSLDAKLEEQTREIREMRKELKVVLDTVARHDERIGALQGWRNGLAGSIGVLVLGLLKEKLGI